MGRIEQKTSVIFESYIDKYSTLFNWINMGWFGSSEEETEIKTVDSNGNINNNVIIQEAKDTHSQMLIGERLLCATYILVGAEVIKLGIYLFTCLRRAFKKKYQKTGSV